MENQIEMKIMRYLIFMMFTKFYELKNALIIPKQHLFFFLLD